MAGVTSTGFQPLTLTDILATLEDAVHQLYGPEFDTSAESPFGQLLGIFAERCAEIWDANEQNYAAFSRDGASGQSLDNIGALTGTPRLPPKRSTVTATLTGTSGTTIPAGTIFAVQTVGTQFQTTVDVTISGSTAVPCESVDTGPKLAPSGSLTVIVNPISGLSTVTNALDAVPGSDLEGDAAYRRRQESELRAAGKAALGSIRDSLLQLAGVTAASVFENATDSTDGNGLPPHSIECLVTGGDDDDIAASVYAEKAAGIAMYGSTSVSVVDSQGTIQTVKFSRPTTKPVYVTLDLVVDPLTWPADGIAQVKAAVVAWGVATLTTGRDVVASLTASQAFKVAGVLDAPPAKIGLTSSPSTTTTIVISLREIALLDTSRIVVNTTNGTP